MKIPEDEDEGRRASHGCSHSCSPDSIRKRATRDSPAELEDHDIPELMPRSAVGLELRLLAAQNKQPMAKDEVEENKDDEDDGNAEGNEDGGELWGG